MAYVSFIYYIAKVCIRGLIKEMIPKQIHYCWFGGNPLPASAQKCINSWKAFLPDYKIIEWNESNFDLNKCDYVHQACQARKWAFVSDFARFQILYEHGGIYFDVDVEVIKNISSIITAGAFMGLEHGTDGIHYLVNPGLGMAATPGMSLYKEILDGYYRRQFIKPNGNIDYTTVVEYVTNILCKYGFNSASNKILKLRDITIYPTEYFCPLNYTTRKMKITENTVSIHHYDGSWLPVSSKFFKIIKNIIGPDASELLIKCFKTK